MLASPCLFFVWFWSHHLAVKANMKSLEPDWLRYFCTEANVFCWTLVVSWLKKTAFLQQHFICSLFYYFHIKAVVTTWSDNVKYCSVWSGGWTTNSQERGETQDCQSSETGAGDQKTGRGHRTGSRRSTATLTYYQWLDTHCWFY